MSTKDELLLKARFHLNIGRINGLVGLLCSNEALGPTSLFQDQEGVRADIFRSVVVFLHATFEAVPRSVHGNLTTLSPASSTTCLSHRRSSTTPQWYNEARTLANGL